MERPSFERKPKARPLSTIALSFSTDLDNIFNLGSVGELAMNIEQKKLDVRTHEKQLQDLDAQLKETEAQLKRLETKHKRMRSEQVLSIGRRKPSNSAHYGHQSDSDSQGQNSDSQMSPRSDDP